MPNTRRGPVYLERKQNDTGTSRVMASTPRPWEDEDTWEGPVIDDQTGTPPGSPDLGDSYIVPCGATGAWAGNVGDIVRWVGNAWRFTEPRSGTTVWVQSRNYFTTFIETTMAAGPITNVDCDFWFPHHFIDASHTIYPGRIVDQLTTPPGSPNLYAAYIVTATATGAWAARENKIAVSICDRITSARTWAFINPQEGMLVWVDDEDLYYVFNGTAWEPLPQWVANRHDLDDIRDVSSGAVAGDVIVYDGDSWEPTDPNDLPSPPHALNEHTDTNFPSPADGDGIIWDAGTGRWVNVPEEDAPVGDHTLGIPHSNVADSVDSATVGHVLTVVGTAGQWAAAPLPAAGAVGSDDVANESGVAGATVSDALDALDAAIGGGGGGGIIVGAVHWPSPSGPWTVLNGAGFSVSNASGGTLTFSPAFTDGTIMGISDAGDLVMGHNITSTFNFALSSPPPTVPTVFTFTIGE